MKIVLAFVLLFGITSCGIPKNYPNYKNHTTVDSNKPNYTEKTPDVKKYNQNNTPMSTKQ